MSRQPGALDEAFEAKLTELRARIDRLPPEQRPHLYELADAIARQRREIQSMRHEVHAAH